MSSESNNIEIILRAINESDKKVLDIIEFTKEEIKNFFENAVLFQKTKKENYRKAANEISGDILIQLLRAVSILEKRNDQNSINTKNAIMKIMKIIIDSRKNIGLNPQK